MDSNEVKADEAKATAWTEAHPRTVSFISGALVMATIWIITKIL